MERFELDDNLKEEIRARVLGEGFMKIVQTVRRNGKTFKISMRPVEIGGVCKFQAEMTDEGQVRVKNFDAPAAAEGLEEGGTRAPFSIVPGIEVPSVLSILATHDIDGYVPGINDILDGYTTPEGERYISAEEKMERGKVAIEAFGEYRELKESDPEAAAEARAVLDENIDYFGYGYIDSREELVPNVPLVYWTFRIMVGFGGLLLLLMFAVLWAERRKKLEGMRWLQWASLLSIPLVYLAGQAGWIVAEAGRQPWVIEGLLPTKAAVSSVSVAAVQTTFFLFVAIFTLFLAIEIRILIKAIKEGPKTEIE
jgi:cytochrome d ubiquinol oxidase subunit I